MLENNKMDGIIGSSSKKIRMKQGQYPFKKDGTLDETAALHTDGYSFYKRKDDPLDYNGKKLLNLTGKIGANSGFSIVEKLKERGIVENVDDGAKTTEQNMKKLLMGRFQGYAEGRCRGDYFLKTHPKDGSEIVRIPTPYGEGGRYLLFSHEFYKKHKEWADQIWALIRELKKSEEYNILKQGY